MYFIRFKMELNSFKELKEIFWERNLRIIGWVCLWNNNILKVVLEIFLKDMMDLFNYDGGISIKI